VRPSATRHIFQPDVFNPPRAVIAADGVVWMLPSET
jgi:hypothetical protein